MKNFVVYTSNGNVIRYGQCQDETFDLQAGENQFVIEDQFYGNQYVENGQLINMPEKPVGEYDFDYSEKTWVFNSQRADSIARSYRDQLLKDGPDRISPIWYNSMTDLQKQEWAQYRKDLLNITSQPDYPNDIIWPIKPGTGE